MAEQRDRSRMPAASTHLDLKHRPSASAARVQDTSLSTALPEKELDQDTTRGMMSKRAYMHT